MSERYSRIFTLESNLFDKSTGVLIEAGAMLKDNATENFFAQLKFSHVANKCIKVLTVKIKPLDSVGRVLGESVEFTYLDMFLPRGESFGSKKLIAFPNRQTRSFEVSVVEVGFEDNTVIASDGNIAPVDLSQEPVPQDCVSAFSEKFGSEAKLKPKKLDGLWCCSCGKLNGEADEKCYACGNRLNELTALSCEEVRDDRIYISAENLLKSGTVGDAEKAKLIFESLGDYRDSRKRADESNELIKELTYQSACDSLAAATLSGAKRAKEIFESLGDHRDSKERAEEARENVRALTYKEACDFLADGTLKGTKKAKEIFESLGDYRDSKERVKETDEAIAAITALLRKRRKRNIYIAIAAVCAVCLMIVLFIVGKRIYLKFADYGEYVKIYKIEEAVIPDGATSIGAVEFAGCTELKSVVIPDSVTSIGNGAFYDCESLTSVVIPDSVTTIGVSAFENCTSLTSVVIPDSVKSIGSSAFRGCINLESIIVPFVGATKGETENTHFGYIFGASDYNANYYNVPQSLKTVVITGASAIKDYAFYNCESLTSVTIPDSVTTIASSAFSYCTSLTSVVIPDSVTTIGEFAFWDCTSLTSIKYRGTQAQWNAISKGDYWDYDAGNCTITYNYDGE